MLKLVVDAMGGDGAPATEVEGAIMAARDFGVGIILVGPEHRLREELWRQGWRADHLIEVAHATEVISTDEPVVQAVRKKRDSTICAGLRLVRDRKAQGFISAGNTGAIMAAAKMILKALGPIHRPALATVIPTLGGRGAVLLDVGANAECRPHHLVQFAIMGDIYARLILGIRTPRVGLISIGAEQLKGNELTRETHKLLEKTNLNFIGNVEGQDIYTGKFDVIICDGFTGNVILKSGEGLYEMLIEVIRQELAKSMKTKVGAILSRPAFQNIKRRFDYAESGGAPLLGVRETCIICHGRSDARAIKNAIRIAKGLHERKATQKIEAEIMKFERLHTRLMKRTTDMVSSAN